MMKECHMGPPEGGHKKGPGGPDGPGGDKKEFYKKMMVIKSEIVVFIIYYIELKYPFVIKLKHLI